MTFSLEEKPFDALRRFMDLIQRTMTADITATEEDSERLNEALGIALYGANLIKEIGSTEDLVLFLQSLHKFAAKKAESPEFVSALELLETITDSTPALYGAYTNLLKSAFEMGFGFGSYEYRKKE